MEIIRTIEDMQAWSTSRRREGRTIGVAPTMGALHDGHLSLVEELRKAGAHSIILTIFVNPTQFGPNEDFEKYPRVMEQDITLCENAGVDAVFAPSVSGMYQRDFTVWVEEASLSKGLCGRSRPGHFRAVATVVAKLFNATLPDIAVFGQKDAQQALILRRMARDLNFPVKVIVSPIVREPDGLAMSSRNKYLSADDRQSALSISRSLLAAKAALESGASDPASAVNSIKSEILAAGGRIDYVEAVDASTLEPISGEIRTQTLVAVAAFFGTTRLIDNIIASPK